MSDRDDFRVGGYNTNSAGPAPSSPPKPTTQLADSIGSGPEVSNDWFTGQWLIERSTWRAYEIGTSHVDEDAIHVITKSAYDAVCAQLAEAHIRIEQHRGALGYPVAGDIPQDMSLQCGMCTAKASECKEWKDEYFNVSKFATDYEYQRDELRALVRELVDGLQQMLDGNGFSNEYTTAQGEAAEALLERAKGAL